jgi:hypothetical protein
MLCIHCDIDTVDMDKHNKDYHSNQDKAVK